MTKTVCLFPFFAQFPPAFLPLLCLALCPFLPLSASGAANALPAPAGITVAAPLPQAVPEAFLGIPYRVDGAIDENGGYTTFADRSRRFATPGLNCSGLVLGISRFLLGRNITLDEAVRDRLGDSGPGAPGGEDWDFGWDLVMNISEGLPRRWLTPGMGTAAAESCSGSTCAGYLVRDDATWRELPGRFRPGRLYLLSLTDYGRRRGYGLQHYHVGLVHVASEGQAWFYQTTGKGARANRRDLKSAGGVDSFRRSFSDNGKTGKSVLVLEVDLPPYTPALPVKPAMSGPASASGTSASGGRR